MVLFAKRADGSLRGPPPAPDEPQAGQANEEQGQGRGLGDRGQGLRRVGVGDLEGLVIGYVGAGYGQREIQYWSVGDGRGRDRAELPQQGVDKAVNRQHGETDQFVLGPGAIAEADRGRNDIASGKIQA